MTEQRRFDAFTRELAALSLKHGIAVKATGGVFFGNLQSIRYDSDASSGDLVFEADWVEGEFSPVADPTLAAIAKKRLGFATLETRNSDSLDFRDVAVWSVKDALQEAYEAGAASAGS